MNICLHTWVWAVMVIFFISCKSRISPVEKTVMLPYLEIREEGRGRILLNKVPSSRIVRSDTAHHFFALSVIFEDSLEYTHAKQGTSMENYYSYQMDRDWALLENGDTLHPVFFHPEGNHGGHGKHSGILVFEPLSSEYHVDTLLFLDSPDYWGKHIISLNKTL